MAVGDSSVTKTSGRELVCSPLLARRAGTQVAKAVTALHTLLCHNNTTYVRLPSLPITSSLLSSLLFLGWQCLINFNSPTSSLRELPPPLLSTLAFFCLVFWSTSLPKQLERKIMPSRMNVQKQEKGRKMNLEKIYRNKCFAAVW